MNGLLLALAMVVGQTAQPKDLAVRIRTSEGSMTGYGSGTILASNEAGQELVLTAKHVTKDARRAWVQYRGQDYPVRKIHQSTRADLAAVEVDLPGMFADVPVSRSPGRHSLLWGYGQSGGLHRHEMSFIADNPGWQEYTPGGNEGDSGAGVYDEAGDLTGVFVAKDTRNRNAVVVSSYELCQFLGGRTASSGSRRVVIFPFFWARSQWGGGSAGSCPPGQVCEPTTPISAPPSTTVTAPGVSVAVGPQGIQGPAGTNGAPGPIGPIGATGPVGPAGPTANIDALTARVTALEGNLSKMLGTVDKASQAIQRPITFNVSKSDGTTSTAQAQLGSTVNLDVADKAIVARLAAIEARLAGTSK